MKSIDQWLDEYGESHKNATNKRIHWIFVPLIMFSIFGILWVIPPGPAIADVPMLNVASIVMAFVLVFYIRLSFKLFLGFLVIAAGILVGNHYLYIALGQNWMYHLAAMVGIFVVSWVFQFIGHNIEGKKPSFTQDLGFFLIGPAWLLHFLYKRVGLPYK